MAHLTNGNFSMLRGELYASRLAPLCDSLWTTAKNSIVYNPRRRIVQLNRRRASGATIDRSDLIPNRSDGEGRGSDSGFDIYFISPGSVWTRLWTRPGCDRRSTRQSGTSLFRRREIKPDRLLDVLSRFFFRFTRRKRSRGGPAHR
jgi:hypothetical protein